MDLAAGCATGQPQVQNLGGYEYAANTGVPAELRYSQVGYVNDAPFDLVVTVVESLGPLTRPPNREPSGCHGMFGSIAIHAGTAVTLLFSFEDSVSNAPVTLPEFVFSVFDLDGNGNERVQIDGFSSYTLREPETNVIDGGDGSCLQAESCALLGCRTGARRLSLKY